MSTIITFDVTAFRLAYPQFADVTLFPTITLQGYWDTAINYISDEVCGDLTEAQRTLALNLMTAHLTALSVLIANGQVPGLMTQATIDKVSVMMSVPPVRTQWDWWLSLTPYGQQLLALLQVTSVGGFYIGGSPQQAAFGSLGSGWWS